MPFAVLDFETTGILPAYQHRVVEVGVVHVDDEGQITGRWETLVKPQRDLGPQSIHGIRAAEVLEAPLFSDIVGDLVNVLAGRTLVAHNAGFDKRFLFAEFERAGYPLDGRIPTLCTMHLANAFGLGGSCSLLHACESFGVGHPRAHSAGGDAYATAELLAAYRHSTVHDRRWQEFWTAHADEAATYSFPAVASNGVLWQGRRTAEQLHVSFLERIAQKVERETAPGAGSEYLALLDRCLLDGLISVSEGGELAAVAHELRLDRATVTELHELHFTSLAAAAWEDGVVTEEERDQLVAVSHALRLPPALVDAALLAPPARPAVDVEGTFERFTLRPGDMIVLTGEMQRMRSEWVDILTDAGFTTHPNITKKVALLAAADADSLSGKARKARSYGIPIVDEAGLARLLGVPHSA